VSNASRTLLFGLESLAWEDELLDMLDIPRQVLPQVRASSEVYGETRNVPGLPDGIPVAGIAGDQQAALFGQACFAPGDAKCTYGTGAFILMNTGNKPVPSKHGLLTTVGWKIGDEVTYALEGSAFIAGAAVQWLRDGLGLIQSAPEIEALAASVEDSGGVVLVPAFAGLGAPHWRPDARGVITGLTRGTTKAHLARAALEGIALQNYDILKAMQDDSGVTLASLKVDGGAAANDLLMQFQADVLGVGISRPKILETTALGAAFLAGLAVGIWTSKDQVAEVWKQDRAFTPTSDRTAVEAHLERWDDAVRRA
jgi:glycerol kinase